MQNQVIPSEIFSIKHYEAFFLEKKPILEQMFNYFDKNKLETMSYNLASDILDSNLDVFDFLYFFQNSIYPNEDTEENKTFDEIIISNNFKEIFRNIFCSKCLGEYYKKYEKFPDEVLSRTNSLDTFRDFYNGIILVSLPMGINGFTDSTLIIFVNNKPRKYKFHQKFKLKNLV